MHIHKSADGKNIAHHIAGGCLFSKNDLRLEVFNPATGKTIGAVSADMQENNLGYIWDYADNAQKCWYDEVTEQEKELIFRAIIANIERHRGALAKTIVLESGKLWRWADAEVQEAIDTLWHYHGEMSRVYTAEGFSRCQMPDKNAFSILKPYGIVLGITPWNFPLAIIFWKLCGALAGGNAIIIKAAEQTPFTAQYSIVLVLEALRNTLPDRWNKLKGLVQLIQGKGETSGKLLLEKLNYDKVAFTGSVETGKIIASTAGNRLKPCHLEMGGHAAMVVLDDFDIDLAVAEAINANLGDSGQRCVSARVVFVQESKYREFVNKYITMAKVRKIGDPMDFETEMGPLISKEQMDRVAFQISKTVKELGREPIFAGDAKLKTVKFLDGYYYSPVVFTEVPYGVTAMDEEIFGPVMVINPLPGSNRKEAFWNAIELINKSNYGLSNAILTNDRRLASRAPWLLKTGLLYIGRGTTGAELNKYFGGVKNSGWGREGKGIGDWTQTTQIYDDYHGKARMAQAGADNKIKKLFSESCSPLE